MSFDFFHPFLLPEEIPNRKNSTESPRSDSEPLNSYPTVKIKKSFTYSEDMKYSSPAKRNTSNWHRPFDFQGAPKISQHTALKYRPADEIEKEIPKVQTTIKPETKTSSSEIHAYYFMELLQDLQDELLAEYKIIVPDVIRNDLEKMKCFIENNAFIPIEKILELIDSEKSILETEIAE